MKEKKKRLEVNGGGTETICANEMEDMSFYFHKQRRPEKLKEFFRQHGYLFMRDLLPKVCVESARRHILDCLHLTEPPLIQDEDKDKDKDKDKNKDKDKDKHKDGDKDKDKDKDRDEKSQLEKYCKEKNYHNGDQQEKGNQKNTQKCQGDEQMQKNTVKRPTISLLNRSDIWGSDVVLKVLENRNLFELMEILMEEEPVAFKYKWMRAVGHGQYTGPHIDKVYFGKEKELGWEGTRL